MAVIVFTGGAMLEVPRSAEGLRDDVARAVAEKRATVAYQIPGADPARAPVIVYHQQIAYVLETDAERGQSLTDDVRTKRT